MLAFGFAILPHIFRGTALHLGAYCMPTFQSFIPCTSSASVCSIDVEPPQSCEGGVSVMEHTARHLF